MEYYLLLIVLIIVLYTFNYYYFQFRKQQELEEILKLFKNIHVDKLINKIRSHELFWGEMAMLDDKSRREIIKEDILNGRNNNI
jgi:hypothetical protein